MKFVMTAGVLGGALVIGTLLTQLATLPIPPGVSRFATVPLVIGMALLASSAVAIALAAIWSR